MTSPIPDMAVAINKAYWSRTCSFPTKEDTEMVARAALQAFRKWERKQVKSGRAIRIAVKCRESK